MPSLFPELFDLSFLAGTILRLAASYVFFSSGARLLVAARMLGGDTLRTRILGNTLGLVHVTVAALLLAGFLTQAAALMGLVLASVPFSSSPTGRTSASDRAMRLLLAAICISVVLIGPGPFAFDLAL